MIALVNKILIFLLMFCILTVVRYCFKFAIAFKKGVSMETQKWDWLKFSGALSYIFTIIFMGLF